MEQLYYWTNEVNVIEHHVSAPERCKTIKLGPLSNYDKTRSAAVLTWHTLLPGEPVPDLLKYVEDRDLWRFEMPYSEEVNLALQSYPQDFEVWQKLVFRLAVLRDEGKGILRARQVRVERCLQARPVWLEIGGHPVPVLNATADVSEATGELAERHPKAAFAATWRADGDDLHWSLRARGDSEVDLAKIAAQYGGGGHKKAAGFKTPVKHPFRTVGSV